MKEFLSREGHQFDVKNVEEDENAYRELLARGYRTVPVTLIADHVVRGFDAAQLSAALRAASQSSEDQ